MNRLKRNFYAAKFMINPLDLGYQKNDMFPNFYMLHYLENTDLIEWRTCENAYYKLKNGRGRTLVTHRKLIYFSITPRLQKVFMSFKTVEHMT